MRDSIYYRRKAREALARAQACDDISAKLGWLFLAERYRVFADPDNEEIDILECSSSA